LRRFWEIAGVRICTTVDEGCPKLGQWLDSMAPYEIAPQAFDLVDLEVELLDGKAIRNTVIGSGTGLLEFLSEGERRVEVHQQVLSGEIIGKKGKYFGVLRLFGLGEQINTYHLALRTALSLVCEESGALMLHASGVVRRGEVWLFAGPCRSGKTTVAVELNSGGTPFAIDRLVVALDADGAPIAHSTPFSDTDGVLNGRYSGVVSGICFIEKASVHSVHPMEPFVATRDLLRQLTTYSRESARFGRTLATVGRLAEAGICYHLQFARDDGFWPLLGSAKRDCA
jgi:hypothetical protein